MSAIDRAGVPVIRRVGGTTSSWEQCRKLRERHSPWLEDGSDLALLAGGGEGERHRDGKCRMDSLPRMSV